MLLTTPTIVDVIFAMRLRTRDRDYFILVLFLLFSLLMIMLLADLAARVVAVFPFGLPSAIFQGDWIASRSFGFV